MACGGCGKRYRTPATYRPTTVRASGPRRPLTDPSRFRKPQTETPPETPVAGEENPRKSGKGPGLPEEELVKGNV